MSKSVLRKIVATAKEVGVLPPEAPQWPNSSSGGCANHVPGDVRWLHRGRLHDDRRRPTTMAKAAYWGGVPPPKNCVMQYELFFNAWQISFFPFLTYWGAFLAKLHNNVVVSLMLSLLYAKSMHFYLSHLIMFHVPMSHCACSVQQYNLPEVHLQITEL